MVHARRSSILSLTALALALCGCERGCLSRFLAERGVGSSTQSSGAAPPTRGFELEGTDCSDGLLRCVDGRVEASRAAHLPRACGPGGPGKQGEGRATCQCPWEDIARCSSGCASDGLEVIAAPSDGGVAQLCRADAPVARPLLPGDPVSADVCTTEGVSCADGIVRICTAAGRPTQGFARCLNGCQSQVGVEIAVGNSSDPGSLKNPDGVVAILCRRDHAERR